MISQPSPFVFCPLVSGSSGNSTYIGYKSTHLLVDCGRSGRCIEQCLESIGVQASQLTAILITHAHIDHIQSVGVLSKRFGIPICASIGTWNEMNKKLNLSTVNPKNIRVFRSDQSLFPLDFGDLQAEVFPLPHDANDPVGYRISNGNASVAVATDLGYVSPILKKKLLGTDVVLLESNHDVEMLQNGPYSFPLKCRILSNVGHLSNENAGLFAAELVRSGTRRLMLGHLSKENNTPGIAYQTVVEVLQKEKIQAQKDIEIFMAHRDSPSRVTTL